MFKANLTIALSTLARLQDDPLYKQSDKDVAKAVSYIMEEFDDSKITPEQEQRLKNLSDFVQSADIHNEEAVQALLKEQGLRSDDPNSTLTTLINTVVTEALGETPANIVKDTEYERAFTIFHDDINNLLTVEIVGQLIGTDIPQGTQVYSVDVVNGQETRVLDARGQRDELTLNLSEEAMAEISEAVGLQANRKPIVRVYTASYGTGPLVQDTLTTVAGAVYMPRGELESYTIVNDATATVELYLQRLSDGKTQTITSEIGNAHFFIGKDTGPITINDKDVGRSKKDGTEAPDVDKLIIIGVPTSIGDLKQEGNDAVVLLKYGDKEPVPLRIVDHFAGDQPIEKLEIRVNIEEYLPGYRYINKGQSVYSNEYSDDTLVLNLRRSQEVYRNTTIGHTIANGVRDDYQALREVTGTEEGKRPVVKWAILTEDKLHEDGVIDNLLDKYEGQELLPIDPMQADNIPRVTEMLQQQMEFLSPWFAFEHAPSPDEADILVVGSMFEDKIIGNSPVIEAGQPTALASDIIIPWSVDLGAADLEGQLKSALMTSLIGIDPNTRAPSVSPKYPVDSLSTKVREYYAVAYQGIVGHTNVTLPHKSFTEHDVATLMQLTDVVDLRTAMDNRLKMAQESRKQDATKEAPENDVDEGASKEKKNNKDTKDEQAKRNENAYLDEAVKLASGAVYSGVSSQTSNIENNASLPHNNKTTHTITQ